MKALVLLSGGLDSRLALKIMQEQLGEKSVSCIYFDLPFGSKYAKEEVVKFARQQKTKLKVIDVTKGNLLHEYLKIIKKPQFRYGTALNPCIDCHLFMIKLAKLYADKNKIELIVTGEVLGERPMSQHNKALKIIEKQSKLHGRLLRPLSAKLLPTTKAERERAVHREDLFDIQGRQRKKQIQLAKKYKISYPSPAGGCLLCEKQFIERIKNLFKNKPINKINKEYIELLRIGRHLESGDIILGRNDKENKLLEKIKLKKTLIIPKQPGPTALIKDKKLINKSKKLIQQYSKHKIKGFEIKS